MLTFHQLDDIPGNFGPSLVSVGNSTESTARTVLSSARS